jgi:signal transduction histidine kinase
MDFPKRSSCQHWEFRRAISMVAICQKSPVQLSQSGERVRILGSAANRSEGRPASRSRSNSIKKGIGKFGIGDVVGSLKGKVDIRASESGFRIRVTLPKAEMEDREAPAKPSRLRMMSL